MFAMKAKLRKAITQLHTNRRTNTHTRTVGEHLQNLNAL